MQVIAEVLKGRCKQVGGRLCKLWGRVTRDERRQFMGDLIIVEGKLEEFHARSRRETRPIPPQRRALDRRRALHVVL